MTTAINGWDATGSNLHLVPPGAGKYGGGYLTGSGGIAWSNAQKAQYPEAVMYDQSPEITAMDVTCDAFDLEKGAVTTAEIAQCISESREAFDNCVRIGQRWPAVYCSWDSKTEVVDALIAGKIDSCPLILADYSFTQGNAIDQIVNASGPFPVVGFQYSDKGGGGSYDLAVYSLDWLNKRSAMSTPTPTPTPKPTETSFSIPGIPGDWKAGSPLVIAGFGPEGESLWLVTTTDGKVFSKTQHISV
jgi:hypothetical protein